MTKRDSHTRALIQYRMERARQTLNAAKLLREEKADTASIVNRAYYAMFYAALALLATIGEKTSKHGGVMALFDKHFIKTGVLPTEMGKFLHTAFDARQIGDYEDRSEISEAMAEQISEFAAKFVNSIEEKLQH
ncbi:MAG: HEPN domain-containing protein [Anaerolineales bacterium]|nr:HEPN domain-containing protein [Anaerolineales bacterium]